MKKFNLILTMLVILSTIATGIIQASSTEASGTIYINDAEDLRKLSKNCSYDRFSQGIRVILNGDIDLKDEAFIPIPIFGGVFDGKGHTIKGLSIVVEGSNQGFFRYLQEGGTIKNLKIEGAVTPTGENSSIGGLVGHNQGTIENCAFTGYIKGKDIVGGLVGWNGNTGMVINSSSKGVIYGKRKIGGIAGYNTGTILLSSNNLCVNTRVEEYKLDFGEIDIDDLDIAKLSKLSPDITDIGGIAGVNTGIIKDSQNHGTIGYPQVGYNVGGIAGRQTGYITNCINEGTVQGRKEVSGIVGQMEPHINIIMPPSKLKQLHKELNTLHSSINRMIENTKHTSGEMGQKLSKIQGDIDAGKTHVKDLINMTEDLIDKTTVIGEDVVDRITSIIKAMEDVAKELASSISLIEESLNHIRKALEKLPEYDWENDELSKSLEAFIAKAKEARDKINQGNSDIREALEILRSGKIDGVSDLLKSASNNLNAAMNDIFQGSDNFKELEEAIKDFISSMGDDIEDDLKTALEDMLAAIKALGDTFDKIRDITDGINDLLTYLTDMPGLDFEKIDDGYQKVREDLLDSIGDMSISLSDLLDTLTVQSKIMVDDMQTINDQMFLVMDLTFSLIDDLMNEEISVDRYYQDVSREDIDKKTEGKVSHCKNFGAIEGDINVGGIAGAMGIEFKSDPEDDLNIMKDSSVNSVFQTSAIIQKCENKGKIIAKKNNVGGIVGSMDLGYILDCVAADLIESTDGDYVGGIAGKSYGPIVSSYAKCTLSGANYIGGIAGYGTEIVDCYTLIKVEKSKACVGAIAGDIDKNNTIKNNYFVSDTLSGIDGISYMDKAEPMGYKELILKGGLPPIFKKIELTFIADDKVIDAHNFNYGDSISRIDLPDIPEKEGYYGKWEEFDEENITFDTVIKANYTPLLTVLESKEKRNDTLPIVLVEGEFTQEDSLTLVYDKELRPPNLEKKTLLEQLTIIIPNDQEMDHTIRYLLPEGQKNLNLYIMTDGSWRKSKSYFDGKYLVFKGTGNTITFCITHKDTSYGKYFALAGVIFLVITLIVYLRKKEGIFMG